MCVIKSRILWTCWMAVLLIALPATAQTIPKGTDALATADGSVADFSLDPLPADFFCPGSAPFTGVIDFVGLPLSTNPPGIVGDADTIIARLAPADLSGGTATVPVKVEAVSMRSRDLVVINCGGVATSWRVKACLCGCECGGGAQATTQLDLVLDDPACGCGHASGELEFEICLTFVNVDTGAMRGPVQRPVHLKVANMPFCFDPPPGVVVATMPFEVDTSCDGVVDCFVPGSEKFVPGVTCGQGGCIPPEPVCHSSFGQADHDHCVQPPCEKREQATSALK